MSTQKAARPSFGDETLKVFMLGSVVGCTREPFQFPGFNTFSAFMIQPLRSSPLLCEYRPADAQMSNSQLAYGLGSWSLKPEKKRWCRGFRISTAHHLEHLKLIFRKLMLLTLSFNDVQYIHRQSVVKGNAKGLKFDSITFKPIPDGQYRRNPSQTNSHHAHKALSVQGRKNKGKLQEYMIATNRWNHNLQAKKSTNDPCRLRCCPPRHKAKAVDLPSWCRLLSISDPCQMTSLGWPMSFAVYDSIRLILSAV